ncbi:MAG: ABC transporter substrate-binding protein [Acidimicrobiales bacterium]|jgi:branched-chain amino acid transport system substrate-binding protein|nr:ABC transporter substrate-binding protein [Acidimicrobiales bacterium]
MRRTARIRTSLVAVAVLLVVAAGCSESDPQAAPTDTEPVACSSDALLDCARRSVLAPYVPGEPTKATGEPIRLGMINQENTPAGSYPELSLAVQAGIEFINEQMGGVDGRPLVLDVCNTEFSAEGSTSCAQTFVEEEVPAVLGGIDVFGNGIETLAQNGIPFVGGIPISAQSFTSPNSFQWSGGSQSAGVAFGWYAAEELGAKKVSIVYQDFGSITDSAEAARKVLGDAGAEVQMVPYPVLATDLNPALTAAASSSPDAMIVFAADSGCKAGFDGVASLGITAATFYVGACAAPAIVDQVSVDNTDGVYFNVDGPLSGDSAMPDGELYEGVVTAYGDGLDPVGAGTVSFRSLMNLYAILSQLGGDITPGAITAALQATDGAPNFGGHPYTCDGEQFDGLPALCSPQQILARMQDRQLSQVTDWIDVGRIYRG